MTQIVDMAAFRGPTAQMVDLSKFTFWGPPQDMDFFYKQSTRTGRAWLRSIHGRTVSYNQLSKAAATHTQNGVTVTKNDDGTVTVSGTATSAGTLTSHNQINTIAGHKYYIALNQAAIDAGLAIFTSIGGNISIVAAIRTATQSGVANVSLCSDAAITYNNVKAYIKTVDLTQAGLDSIITTPEQFEAWQMEQFGHTGYIAYTPGKLVNVNPTGVLTTGRNVWDEELEEGLLNVDGTVIPASGRYCSKNHIPCGLASKYYFYLEGSNNFNTICYYDANFALVGYEQARKGERTIPSGAVWAKFGLYSTYTGGHICINISDPAFNGQYEPYNGVTTPLDFTEHFATGMNGVNGIFDEAVSDENGKFTDGGKRFGVVDLGTLDWSKTTTAVPNTTCFQAYLPIADFGVAICAKYYLAGATRYILATKDKAFAPYNDTNLRNTIVVRDSDYDNATAADFKAAMAGVPLIYELATPQHVTFTDPSDAVYPVTEGGTEQVLPVNGSEPTTGPLLGKVSYKQGRSAQ